jgi:thiamine kinase
VVKSSGQEVVLSSVDGDVVKLLQQRYRQLDSVEVSWQVVSGTTACSWHVKAPPWQWLARQDSKQKRSLGIRLRKEQRVLHALADSQISPRIVAVDSRWLLIEWLEGQHPPQALYHTADVRQSLMALLVRLHCHTPSGYTLDLRRQLQHYWQSIDRRRVTPAWLKLHHRFMRQTLPTPLKLALIHLDVHAGNILLTAQGLRLIDWEYAADSDIALELAALFCAQQWDAAQQQQAIDEYCAAGGYGDAAKLTKQIARWMPWVDYLMFMWYEVRWQQTRQSTYLLWAEPLRQRLLANG